MSAATELRTWLNRPTDDFCTSLQFGIRAWRSLEFVLITKHEIITEEFCRQLPALRKQLRKSGRTADDAWSLVCEFLSLRYASGAISSAVKEQLVSALRTEARKTVATPHPRILEALLLTLHQTPMQNFYKSSPDALADLIGTIAAYLAALAVQPASGQWLQSQQPAIAKLLASLLQFVRHSPLLDVFRRRFAAEPFVQLTELVIGLRAKGHNYSAELFAIVQEIFFPAGSLDALNTYLKAGVSQGLGDCEFATMFTGPTHSFALWLETIVIAAKLHTDTQVALHKFLFAQVFREDGAAADLLPRVTYYLSLCKRHDLQMSSTVEGTQSVSGFLGQQVERLFEQHYTHELADTLALLCAALRLDPMTLEHAMLPVTVKCMVQPKDAVASERYAEFLDLVITVFRKLSRGQKFVAHLMRILVELLAVKKLSSKLKRKSVAAVNAAPGSAKKSKADAELGADLDADEADATVTDTNRFFALLQSDFAASQRETAATAATVQSTAIDWPEIAFAWPATVGTAFQQFIGGLVSRSALVVWKTILFALTDYVSLLKEGHSDANTLFLVDICSALLCQYFAGVRLAEHTAQMWSEIDPTRTLTHSLLHEFGKAILSKEHNNRTMNAFLKCCAHAGDFELLCFYYWPDTLQPRDTLRHVHPYLLEPPQQWTLVEQRITNFGRDECKANLNRVYLQRMYGLALFEQKADVAALLGADEPVQVRAVLGRASAAVLVERMPVAAMRELCAALVAGDDASSEFELSRAVAPRVLQNKRFVLVLYLELYNQACAQFASAARGPPPIDGDQLLAAIGQPEYADVLAELVIKVEESAAAGGSIKKANIAGISAVCRQLRALPTDFLDIPTRNVLFVLKTALFVGAKKTGSEQLVAETLALLKAFVHFGETPELFAVLPIGSWVSVFGSSAAVLPLYQTAFERVTRDLNATNLKMFDSLLALLGAGDADADGLLDIAMVLVDQLAKERKCKETFAAYRRAILQQILAHFAANNSGDDGDDVAFVARTLSGFAVVLTASVTKADAAADTVDAGVQAAFKVYLQHASLAGNFAATTKLLQLALAHKTLFALTDEELGASVGRFWADYLRVLQSPQASAIGDDQSAVFLKAVLNSKTSEEFIELLDNTEPEAGDVVATFCSYKHQLFASIGRCQLNKVKGSIFVEIFKQFALRVVLSLRALGALQLSSDAVLKLLECQRVICANVQLPISVPLVDDILAFLSEINIRQFVDEAQRNATVAGTGAGEDGGRVAATRIEQFVRLHSAIADVCYALVQHRHHYVVDRVPHFQALVHDLMRAVAFYKSAPAKVAAAQLVAGAGTGSGAAVAAVAAEPATPLTDGEVQMLADLSHRIENIIKSFVKQSKDVKRIAPYLLLSTVYLLVSDEQPTTNYPKIKTHFDFICFDLMSIFDHRVDGFVMRNCNEAAKQVYDQLNRDFNKYHKFKGKV